MTQDKSNRSGDGRHSTQVSHTKTEHHHSHHTESRTQRSPEQTVQSHHRSTTQSITQRLGALRVGGRRLKTPFIAEIMLTRNPGKVKIPTIDPYDGTSDSDDHLAAFTAQMCIQSDNDAVWCKYFPTTLKGLAQSWFNDLAAGSISSFDQLSAMFSNHFVTSKRQKKTSWNLMSVGQREDESLKEYVKRFTSEAMLIPDLPESVAMAALMKGLKNTRFKFALVEDNVTSFTEALGRAEKHIRASEICSDDRESRKRGRSKERTKGDDRKKGRSHPQKEARPQREADSDRFRVSRREILMEVKDHPMLKRPEPIKTPSKFRNQKKWCEYHKELGHETSECWDLRKALDELADRGKLDRFVKRGDKKDRHPRHQGESSRGRKDLEDDRTTGVVP